MECEGTYLCGHAGTDTPRNARQSEAAWRHWISARLCRNCLKVEQDRSETAKQIANYDALDRSRKLGLLPLAGASDAQRGWASVIRLRTLPAIAEAKSFITTASLPFDIIRKAEEIAGLILDQVQAPFWIELKEPLTGAEWADALLSAAGWPRREFGLVGSIPTWLERTAALRKLLQISPLFYRIEDVTP